MKPLSKLHQEAIIKAQNATDQNRAAAMAMIEKPIEMIKAIMLKHELAVIEVMRELHESREAAVIAEREAIAQSLDKQADLADDPMDRKWAQEMAAAVRARGNNG
jgi:putative heme iron utilization protein